jgi:opacity protein-like surface antigen
MLKKLSAIIFFTLCCATQSVVFSQTSGRKLYPGMTKTRGSSTVPISRKVAYQWTWMLGIGRTSYMGSLCETGDCYTNFDNLNFQINAGLKYRFTTRWSAGVSFRYFTAAGADSDFGTLESGRLQRNLSFSTQGYELMAFGNFDLIPIITKFIGEKADQYNRRNPVVPYLTGGIGLLYFNPRAEYNGEMYSLRKVITDDIKEKGEFYSPFTFVASAGAGVRVKVTEFFDVGADFSINRPFTQYFDDISSKSKYPSWNRDRNLAPDEISWALADRHEEIGGQRVDVALTTNPYRARETTSKNPDNANDYYFIVNIRLDYTLSSPLKFKNPRHMHFRAGKGTKNHQFNQR